MAGWIQSDMPPPVSLCNGIYQISNGLLRKMKYNLMYYLCLEKIDNEIVLLLASILLNFAESTKEQISL